MAEKKQQETKTAQVSINLDSTPILYTDNINMTTNENGVVLNVMQALGPTNQVRIVARVGMSRDHAKKFVERLGQLLVITEGKGQSDSGDLN